MFNLAAVVSVLCPSSTFARVVPRAPAAKQPSVLILGGGVAGIIAARTLHAQGIDDFELGGRMMSHPFGRNGANGTYTVEAGANWIQGTCRENPILTLATKHGVKTVFNDFDNITSYDYTGFTDYLDVFNKGADDYVNLTLLAGGRVPDHLVDTTSRTGYQLDGVKPKTPHEMASEYFQFDWEYAQTPEQTSWVARPGAQAFNFTFDPEGGGFSEDNLLAVDQRGFKTLIQAEANECLKPNQVSYNSVVKTISYSGSGVRVTLANGTVLSADYALCTFSLGVLQNDDVVFQPELPEWKQEAIYSMTMATYTKLFLQFPKQESLNNSAKFWFDSELGLYADRERGRYPVWQSLDVEGFLPGSGILFATVTGDWSERIEALPKEQVKKEVMSVVRTMFPDVDVPDPIDFYYPTWFSDPLFRGSYSNWPASFVSDHHQNLHATVAQRLWFAGEATSQRWFGFLHGAYFEGLDIGGKLAGCINSGGCAVISHVEQVQNLKPYVI